MSDGNPDMSRRFESTYVAAALICCGYDCRIEYERGNAHDNIWFVFVAEPGLDQIVKNYMKGKLTLDTKLYVTQLRKLQSRFIELFNMGEAYNH